MTITITLNGKSKKVEKNVTVQDIVKKDFPDKENEIIAAKIDNQVVDLSTKLTKDSKVELLTFKDEEGKEVF